MDKNMHFLKITLNIIFGTPSAKTFSMELLQQTSEDKKTKTLSMPTKCRPKEYVKKKT